MEKKHLICLGAAKAGTTWLSEQCRRHPSFFMPPMKEIHYFQSVYGQVDRLAPIRRLNQVAKFLSSSTIAIEGADDEKKRQRLMRRQARLAKWYALYAAGRIDEKWYLRLFDGAESDQFLCDFSAASCKVSVAGVEAMYRLSGQTYVVYILRDPFDRLVSHTKFHAKFVGDIKWMRRAKRAEVESYVRDRSLIEDSLYAHRIEQFREKFGKDRLLLLDFDELRRQPVEFLNRLSAFLNVPRFAAVESSRGTNPGPDLMLPEGAFDSFRSETDAEVDRLVNIGVDFAAKWRR